MTYIKSKSFHQAKSISNRGTAILSLIIFIAFFLMSFFYLIQTNGVVSKTYQIRQEQQRLEKLRAEKSTLEIEAARLQSPANLGEIAKTLGMEEAVKVVYLKEKGAVAIKK